MARPDYYRKRAEACALAAQETEDWEARERYTSLAQKFLELAEAEDAGVAGIRSAPRDVSEPRPD